jgi:hypothetical protein
MLNYTTGKSAFDQGNSKYGNFTSGTSNDENARNLKVILSRIEEVYIANGDSNIFKLPIYQLCKGHQEVRRV